MNIPEPLSPVVPNNYLSLKTGKANKTGQRSHGHLHYRILTDSTQQRLYITITHNDGGGYYAKEVVPFDKIENCLEGLTPDKPLTAKIFQPAFIGQSSNNAGFLAAILRAEHLLALAAESKHHHVLQPDWAGWKADLLALVNQAEPYQPEPRTGKAAENPTKTENTEPANDGSGNDANEEKVDLEANTNGDEHLSNPSNAGAIQPHNTSQDNLEPDNSSITTVVTQQQTKKQPPKKRQPSTAQSNCDDHPA